MSISCNIGFTQPLPPPPIKNDLPALDVHKTRRYSFGELNSMLLDQNPTLKASVKNLDLAQHDIAIAKLRPNPKLGLFAQTGRIASTLGNPQQVSLTQTIELGGKRVKRTSLANLAFVQAQFDYQTQIWQLRNILKQRYISLAHAEISLLILQAQKKLLNSLVDIAAKRFKYGAAPEVEVLQAKLASRQLDPQLSNAHSVLEQAQSDVDVLFGNALPDHFRVIPLELSPSQSTSSGLPSLGLNLLKADRTAQVQTLYEDALMNRSDYLSLKSQFAQAGQQIIIQQAERKPSVEVTAGYQTAFNTPDPFQNNTRRLFQGPYLGMSVPLPIWHQFKVQVAKATTQKDQIQLQIMAAELAIRSDVEKAVSRLIAANKTWREYDQGLLPDTSEVVHLAQESYRYGKTGLVNVIVSQQTAEQIRQSYLDAIVEYQLAWMALEIAVGHVL